MRLYLNRTPLEAQIARTLDTGEAPSFCRIGTLDVEYVHPRWPRGGIFVQTEHDYDDTRYGVAYVPAKSTGIVAWLMPGWRIDWGPGRWHPTRPFSGGSPTGMTIASEVNGLRMPEVPARRRQTALPPRPDRQRDFLPQPRDPRCEPTVRVRRRLKRWKGGSRAMERHGSNACGCRACDAPP